MVENDNQMTMEDLDQIINDNPPGTPPPDVSDTSANAETQESAADATTATDTTATADNAEGEGADAAGNQAKANAAWAEMRTTNRKMQDALAAVLQQHGLDPALAKNPDQLIQDAENARLEAEAKKQQVPTDLLKRLTHLEKANLENDRTR